MKTILVVEDRPFIARDLEELGPECGLAVLGPVTDFGAAVVRACQPCLAGAVLETRTAGDRDQVWALADLLRSRNVPIMFVTAWPTREVPERFQDVACLQIPYARDDLRQAVISTFRAARPASERIAAPGLILQPESALLGWQRGDQRLDALP